MNRKILIILLVILIILVIIGCLIYQNKTENITNNANEEINILLNEITTTNESVDNIKMCIRDRYQTIFKTQYKNQKNTQ